MLFERVHAWFTSATRVRQKQDTLRQLQRISRVADAITVASLPRPGRHDDERLRSRSFSKRLAIHPNSAV